MTAERRACGEDAAVASTVIEPGFPRRGTSAASLWALARPPRRGPVQAANRQRRVHPAANFEQPWRPASSSRLQDLSSFALTTDACIHHLPLHLHTVLSSGAHISYTLQTRFP